MTAMPFRFDAEAHEYIDLATGAVLPHITSMLQRSGIVDAGWYTDASRERGTAVHRLTADYDLGALDPAKCISAYRGYLLAHHAAMTILKGQGLVLHAIEEPLVHPTYRYGGRPDRIVSMAGRLGVLELKSGGPERGHQVQTSLQAILACVEARLPAESLGRWCLYLKESGKFKLEEHRRREDFVEAHRIIRTCCGTPIEMPAVAPFALGRPF